MAQVKKIGMAAGTFGVALGIGFVMQNGDALASRFGGGADEPAPFVAASPDDEIQVAQAGAIAPEPGPALAPVDGVTDVLASTPEPVAPELQEPESAVELAVTLPEDARVPEAPAAPVQLASVDPDPVPELAPIAEAEQVASTDEIDCVPTVLGAPSGSAMVDLAISAPCHAASSFTVHHQGMMFTAATGETGAAKVTVPALAEVAVMIVAFETGDGAVATVTVPDFASYDRAVLQWQGNTSVMLSAYENGAEFGDPSHIYSGNPGTPARIETAEGGYLMTLGDASLENALMAEVYTFPSGMMNDPLDVMLVAEAEITADNCGQELNAQSIQVSPTGDISALDLQLMMPDCEAVGDFLILQNMFEDLTLASR